MQLSKTENRRYYYKNIFLFQGMTEDDAADLMKAFHSTKKAFKKGEYIFLKDECINYFCIVLSGKIDVVYDNMWGDRTVLNTLSRGMFFGEGVFYRPDYRVKASYKVESETLILFIPVKQMIGSDIGERSAHQRFMHNLLMALTNKNVRFMHRIQCLSEKILRKKILSYLYCLSQETESNTVILPFSRSGFASYLCSNRTAVIRVLNELKAEGIIDFERNTFTLLKKE